ncbi:MAG: metal transporter permease, partial [Hyphomicrobiales bacterium]|nr:metal transporter permease [Hyphomicrobiales bacterium]
MPTNPESKKPPTLAGESSLYSTVRHLWAYMWPAGRMDLKLKVILALVALAGSKVATTLSPFAYKGIIDGLNHGGENQALVLGIAVPVVLMVAYGV